LDFVDQKIFFAWSVGIDHICKIMDVISRSAGSVLALEGVCFLYDVPTLFSCIIIIFCHFFKSSLGHFQRANVEGCSRSGNMYISAGNVEILFVPRLDN
jgi:hypothetical protein